MRALRLTVVLLAAYYVSGVPARGQAPDGPLPQFSGDYRIVQGPAGSIQVAPALGGSNTEWRITAGRPSHEHRLLVGARAADGNFRVWRFEQDPAPEIVGHEGLARLEGSELVADFHAPESDRDRHMLRERWRLTAGGGLEFSLEASTNGQVPRRVGGFVATRQ